MAAAPVNPPNPDDVSGISSFLLWFKDWGWGIVGSVGLPGAWHVGSRITSIERRLEQHAEKFAEQTKTNDEIKTKIDMLADKDDVREIKQDLREMRSSLHDAFSGRSAAGR